MSTTKVGVIAAAVVLMTALVTGAWVFHAQMALMEHVVAVQPAAATSSVPPVPTTTTTATTATATPTQAPVKEVTVTKTPSVTTPVKTRTVTVTRSATPTASATPTEPTSAVPAGQLATGTLEAPLPETIREVSTKAPAAAYTRIPAAAEKCGVARYVQDSGKSVSLTALNNSQPDVMDTIHAPDCVLKALGAPDYVLAHLDHTRGLDGNQTDTWPGFSARWTFDWTNGVNLTVIDLH